MMSGKLHIGSLRFVKIGKPTNQPMVDPKLAESLIEHGMPKDQVILNINELREKNSEKKLIGKSFYHFHQEYGDKCIDNFNSGTPRPGGYGQSAAFVNNGMITLTTFAGSRTQFISQDKNGIIRVQYF
jgi:hypothetical protein